MCCYGLPVKASIANARRWDGFDEYGPSFAESISYGASQCPGVGGEESIREGSARDSSDVIPKLKDEAKVALLSAGLGNFK